MDSWTSSPPSADAISRYYGRGLAFLCAVAVAGCGGGHTPWETAYATKGKVLFKGQPVAGAQVTLYPKDSAAPDTIRPTAVTDAAGEFALSTHRERDGAPAGEYRAAVVWHPLVDVGAGPTRGPNKLPARYATPDTSALEAKVEPRETVLPAWDLQAK